MSRKPMHDHANEGGATALLDRDGEHAGDGGEDVATATAEGTDTPRVAAEGDEVFYWTTSTGIVDGHWDEVTTSERATVARVHRPGDARSTLDLIIPTEAIHEQCQPATARDYGSQSLRYKWATADDWGDAVRFDPMTDEKPGADCNRVLLYVPNARGEDLPVPVRVVESPDDGGLALTVAEPDERREGGVAFGIGPRRDRSWSWTPAPSHSN